MISISWQGLGLMGRLLLLVGSVIVLGTIAILLLLTKHDANHSSQHLQVEAKEAQQILLPVLAEETASRRYASIHSLLTNYVFSNTDISNLSWTFLDGVTKTIIQKPPARKSPQWFRAITGLSNVEMEQSISTSANKNGTLIVQVSSVEEENRLWDQFTYLARSVLLVIVLVFVTIAIILKKNLRTIRELSHHANQFRQGDLSVRVPVQGAPELKDAARAFNELAENTEQLLTSLLGRGSELSAQLNFTRQLIEALPMPMYYLDKHGCLLGANKAWCKMFGVTVEQSVGMQAKDIYRSSPNFAMRQQIKDALLLSNGVDQQYESRFRDGKDNKHYLLMAKSVFTDAAGEVAGLICSIVDLSDRRAAEKEKRAALLEKAKAEQDSETKSRFLANMSHEMRTPLTAIIGLAETLFDKERSELDRINSTQTIIRAGRHLSQLINDLLDLSKMEAGKLQLDMQPVSLVDVVKEVQQMMVGQTEDKNIYFVVNYIFPVPKSFISDSLRLKQVLLNLLSNAVKFTNKGGVTLSVAYQADLRLVHIDVEDTGIGISEEQANRLFSPFSQADASISRKYGGTGLGLYLSQKLSEMLHGKVTLESEVGKGSCFRVTLEIDEAEDVELLTQLPDGSNVVPEVRSQGQLEMSVRQLSGHVLLAEDNTDNQALISHLLKKQGLTVDVANNGKEAISYVEACQYELILMDMQMPVMGGLEAVRHLRAKGCPIPIVALTANGSAEDEQQCRQAGCNDFLLKPIDHKMFHSVLQSFTRSNDDCLKDQPIVSSLLEIDPEFHDLVEQFVDRLPGMIVDIENHILQDSPDSLANHLHMLKGLGGNMGYQIITDIAHKMEEGLQSNRLDDVESLVVKLKDTSQRIQAGL